MQEDIKLNIQPKAGILGVFSRLNYKPWYAIGEFVDNSTASFFAHERTMNFNRIRRMTVKITYNQGLNELTIEDDAYGMEITDFQRAIKLDSKPENINGRNEFGMGLKTAASWFGNIWSVESTQLGSENKYYAEVNIPELRENNINSINIIKTKTDKESHGTIIRIRDVTKKIGASKTVSKIKDLLSSMYRRDLKTGKIEILYNGDPLKYEEYSVLKFRDQEWKKDLDFDFEFDNKNFKVTGFVAIMAKGSFPKAGFALFRYDRVVIGGLDENYKPNEIFGQAQSQISLKLFGELNMEDFPVNQAKDGFVWDDGLQDEFIKALKLNIADFIDIASISTKARSQEEEFSKESSDFIEEEINKKLDQINKGEPINLDEYQDENVSRFIEEMNEDNDQDDKIIDLPREYTVNISTVETKKFKVYWQIGKSGKWFDYMPETSEIVININHPFFKPYSAEKDFKEILDKFVLAFAIAEEKAKALAVANNVNNGYVLPSAIRNIMNEYLEKLSK